MSRAGSAVMEQRVRVLIVDMRAENREIMERFLTAWNFEPLAAASAGEALEAAASRAVSIAIVAEPLAGMRGMELVRALRQADAGMETILLAEDDSAAYATEAFRCGAYNCLRRPVDFKQLSRDLNTLREAVQRRMERKIWEQDGASVPALEGMVGFSASMQAVFAAIRRFAPERAPVLITGLIGTGKEMAAQALHKLSGCAGKPLVIYRCCGVSESLAELELFGYSHEAGRVSADCATLPAEDSGILHAASGGSILLDEISDLPLSIQQRIAITLTTSGSAAGALPARLLATTRLNLADLAARGQFDPELYRLLSQNVIHMPSLGERPEDVPMLCRHFLAAFNREFGKSVGAFAPAAERLLLSYSWPGNVRELENVIGRACLLADQEWIELQDLSIASMNNRSGWEPVWPKSRGAAPKTRSRHARRRLRNSASVGPDPAPV